MAISYVFFLYSLKIHSNCQMLTINDDTELYVIILSLNSSRSFSNTIPSNRHKILKKIIPYVPSAAKYPLPPKVADFSERTFCVI